MAAGLCGVCSAASPVVQATDDLDTYFYAHTPAMSADGKLRLLEADRIDLPGQQIADISWATQTESEFVGDNAPGDPA